MTITHEATPVAEPAPEPKRKKAKKSKAPAASQEPTPEIAPDPEQPAPETSAPGPKPKKAKKSKEPVATPEQPATEQPAPAEPSEPAPAKSKSKKPAKRPVPLITMKLLSERYIQHLAESGKSQGTALSYLIEMTTATKFLGEDTAIASLTPDDVRRFNDSKIVMFKRDGKTPKAAPSYLKTQRVLRLALVWAAEQGWIETAPIPADESESK